MIIIRGGPLHPEDNVRAEEALNPSFSVEGWFMSKESQVARAGRPAGRQPLSCVLY